MSEGAKPAAAATLIDELALARDARNDDLCERAGRALELARELFVLACTERESAAECVAHAKHTDALASGLGWVATGEKLDHAKRRTETKRRAAIERFNKATGL